MLGAQHILTPSLQVRYLYGSFGSHTETGSSANLTVNRRTVQTLEERVAAVKLTRKVTLLELRIDAAHFISTAWVARLGLRVAF